MKKAEFLAHWRQIPDAQAIQPTPIPYKHEGSTYDQDGIRITGTREFIDSVLSHLKSLLKYEGGATRLQVVYQEVKDRETQRPTGTYSCYIQVHRRGPQAAMVNAIFGGP